jgi:hypothetical protein
MALQMQNSVGELVTVKRYLQDECRIFQREDFIDFLVEPKD